MTEVLVALVGASGIVTVALIEKVRRQNSREHQENGGRIQSLHFTLGQIDGKLDGVTSKIDNHLDDHRGNR